MSTKIIPQSPANNTITKAPKLDTAPCRQVFDAAISPTITIKEPFYLNAALKFQDKIFDNSEDFVEKVAFRKAIANYLCSQPGVLDVKWRETLGILELGPRINVCLPADSAVGVGVSLEVGFEASGLLAYRYARPKPIQRVAPNKLEKSRQIYFPNSVEKARKMAIGSETELRGRGKLLGNLGGTLNAGAGVLGVARAGVAVSLAACKSISGEYCLSVTALGDDKVRVKITKINEEESQVGCNMRAGILYLCTPANLIGENALKNFVVNATKSQIENLILNYVSVLASFSKNSKNKDTNICCYDLDLQKPTAQEAYTRLVSLCPGALDTLMELQDNGIERVRLKEQEDNDVDLIDIQAFNKKLFLRELADIDNAGILVNHDESRVYYCDKIYSEKFESIIYGTKQIRWEGIELNQDNKDPENYYRFFYEQCANIPTQEEVDKFFDLAGRLGIRISGEVHDKLIDMSSIKMLGSSEDDMRTKIEIFFTQNGITKLQDADDKIGSQAFQKANGLMAGAQHQPQANNALEAYDKINTGWFSWFSNSALKEIACEYEEKFERSFEKDYAGFVKAKRFGELVNNFNNAKNRNQSKDFFAMLGKADFSYEEILVALNALMGRENILIHQLSLSGGKVNLESSDEGALLHPREKAQNLFNRIHS